MRPPPTSTLFPYTTLFRSHTPVQLRIDQCEQLLTEDLAHGGDVVGAEHLDTPAEVVHELIGGVGAEVRLQQRLLDLVPGVLVDAAAGEQVQDRSEERRVGIGTALCERRLT